MVYNTYVSLTLQGALMKNQLFYSVLMTIFFVTVGLGTYVPVEAVAAPPKNLQVFPKNTTKKVLKKKMKKMAAALDVQCDYCHNTRKMEEDTKHKKVARDMLRMTAAINKANFKGKDRVTCLTCHNGQKEPK